MTTATQEAPASLLPIETVVEQAVAAAAAQAEQYRLESESKARRRATERLENFRKNLEGLGIDARGVEDLSFEFDHASARFRIFPMEREWDRLYIVRLCARACGSWAGPYSAEYLRDALGLGHYVSSNADSEAVCSECHAAEQPERQQAVKVRQPTIEERLYAIVREIALDAAMEAREL